MKEIVGIQACLMLQALVESDCVGQRAVLEDIAEDLDAMDARALVEIIEKASSRLKELRRCGNASCRASVLKIDASYRIFIDGREDREIVLRPIPKTIFILFLKHPEGITLRTLGRCREEILQIYRTVSPRLDNEGMERSIDLLLSPSSNSFRQQKSRLRRSLERYFDDNLVQQYLIAGERSGRKAICLDRTFVQWNYRRDF